MGTMSCQVKMLWQNDTNISEYVEFIWYYLTDDIQEAKWLSNITGLFLSKISFKVTFVSERTNDKMTLLLTSPEVNNGFHSAV